MASGQLETEVGASGSRIPLSLAGEGLRPNTGHCPLPTGHLQDRFGWPTGLYVYLVIALVPAAVVLFATS